jgi:hypothetical protein
MLDWNSNDPGNLEARIREARNALLRQSSGEVNGGAEGAEVTVFLWNDLRRGREVRR